MNWRLSMAAPRAARQLFFTGVVAIALTGNGVARANIDIVPTFDSTITSDPNASTIEAAVNATIARVEAEIASPITVNIDFQEMTSGLGSSQTTLYTSGYSTYRSLLAGRVSPTADDRTALSSLPNQLKNPVTNSSSTEMAITSALFRALGQNAPGTITVGSTTNFDGIVSLNTSLCNLSRTGTQNPFNYDLQAVAGHEIDEVLGIGGSGSTLNGIYDGDYSSTAYTGALDLFRYSSKNVRSFTTSATANSYFSINSGATNFVYFDQNGVGADYADWGNGTPNSETGNTPPQLQDAFGTPGVQVDIGEFELAALDVEGYELTTAGANAEATLTTPEPASCGVLLVGAVGLLARRRRVPI